MNSINRHNYETFFLLYTDNELSVEERKAVDEFVEANPDLQEELVMLKQSVLKPDTILFGDKSSLLKTEFASSELQERLLLYLDNELAPLEMNETDTLINSNADIKKEWDLLQQTKLTDESVIFKDKQLLYRKETGRLVAFPWKRVAAAAVLIGFSILGGLLYFSRDGDMKTGDFAATKIGEIRPNIDSVKKDANQAVTPAPVQSPIVKEQEIAVIGKSEKSPAVKSIKPVKKVEMPRLTKEEIQPIAAVQKTNNLPERYSDNLNKIDGNRTFIANVTNENHTSNIADPGNNETVKGKGNNEKTNEFATTASYVDEDNNNNRVLFMDEERIKKTKLGGIFRKVKRVFERNTNMKSGSNNIKVANLEFAIQ